MKVGLLVPGGVDRSGEYRVIPCLLWFIERIAKKHDVHVFALAQELRPSRYQLLGAEVHAIGAPLRSPRMAWAVLREHRLGRFDVLHAFWANSTGSVGAVVGKLLGVPMLLHITGGDLARLPDIDYGALKNWRGRFRLRCAVRGAAQITTPSREMQTTAERLGIQAKRLPLGVALDRWPVAAPHPGGNPATGRLIHVASLNEVKDQVTLIRAVRDLRDRGCEFHLDVVGDDTLGGRIQALCRESGVGDRVTFHGFLPHSLLRPLFQRAQVLVISSRHEADPIVLLEAAVAGVPAVSTAVGHALDWAPDAIRTVPVGDYQGLAREIELMLASEDNRLKLAISAQERATREDADWSAGRAFEIYEELIPGDRSENPQA